MKKLILLLTVIFLGLAVTGCTKKEVDYAFHNEGESYLSNSEYDEALLSFKKSINQNPSLTESYIFAAQILADKNLFEDAIEILDAGIGFAGDQSKIYQKLGEVYYLSGDFDAAEFNYSKAYARNGDNLEAYAGFVKLLIKNGNDSKAKDVADDRLDLNDEDSLQLLKLGLFADDLDLVDKILGNTENLSELFGGLKNLETDTVAYQMQIEQSVINSTYKFAAIPVLSSILEANEYYDGAYLYRGLALLDINSYSEAEADFASCIRYNPDLADCYRYLALSQMSQEKYEDSRQNFDLALNFGQDQRREILIDYTKLLELVDDKKTLIQMLDEIISLDGGEEYKVKLGRVYCMEDGFIDELTGLVSGLAESDPSLESCLLVKKTENIAGDTIETLKTSNDTFSYYVLYLYYNEKNSGDLDAVRDRLRELDVTGEFQYLIDN